MGVGGETGPAPPPVCFSIQGVCSGGSWDRHIWLPLARSVPTCPQGHQFLGFNYKEIRLNPFLPSSPAAALSSFSFSVFHAFQERVKGKEE